MKFIVLALIVCLASANFLPIQQQQQQQLEFATSDVSDFLVGFALTFRALELVPDGIPCALDALTVQGDVSSAMDLIHQGGLENYVVAAEKLYHVFYNLDKACLPAAKEGRTYFTDIYKIVKGPHFRVEAFQALVKYHNNVFNDSKEIYQNYESHDYLSVGAYFGDIARIIVWGEPSEI